VANHGIQQPGIRLAYILHIIEFMSKCG